MKHRKMSFLEGSAFFLSAILVFGVSASEGARNVDLPPDGGAVVWYLGHCGYAVRTQNHLLVFDYQERQDGRQPKSRPDEPSLDTGWIDPREIKDLKVRVFVSHSHEDHYDPVILNWRGAVPDIAYYFGWKAAEDPSHHDFVDPRAEIKSGGLEIATINSHHSGVPEVAWLVKVDGLVIYHNGDCRPDDPVSEHEFLKTRTDAIDLAFVFPVTQSGEKYTIQEEDFFRKFKVGAAFPMHAQAGDAMYLEFQKVFHEKFPGLRIHLPMKMGQKFVHSIQGRDKDPLTKTPALFWPGKKRSFPRTIFIF
jgi:L-ascorbate metabolism protein UlaG (beta-lactamase superfamily)